MKRNRKNIDEVLKQHLPRPTSGEIQSHCDEVLRNLQAGTVLPQRAAQSGDPFLTGSRWQRLVIVPAAAGVVLAVIIGIVWRQDALAVGESVDGSLYRVVDGRPLALKAGEKIGIGDTVRTDRDGGGMIRLADGSNVEVRSESELSFEGANPAVQILMNRGGLLVNAAKQREGRQLSVRTKDFTVSVGGTVFLVNTEEEGSRVAVIQGEVRVQQGGKQRTLRTGEQVATNPAIEKYSVPEEIAWSRHAGEHLALLQQALPQPAPARVAFEVVSIRPGADPAAGAGGRGGNLPFGFGCGGGSMQLGPARLVMITNLYTLVAMAHGKDCVSAAQLGLLSGGPAWATSDQYTIQATMPEGAPAYTRREFMDGNAPRLQLMLQTMLAERFKLSLRRENREMDAYALVVGKNGPKLTPSREGSCDPTMSAPIYRGQAGPDQRLSCVRIYTLNPQFHFNIEARSASMETLAKILTSSLRRPVIDRTGIAGVFDISLESSTSQTIYEEAGDEAVDNLPPIFEVLQEQLGLKLESTKAPVEGLVIDRLERPSEN